MHLPDVTRPPTRRAGFTLLEVILATMVTALVAAALFASLSIALRTKHAAEDQLAGRAQLRSAIDAVRRDLLAVPPPTGLLAGPMVGVDSFTGTGASGDYLAYSTPSTDAGTTTDAQAAAADYEQVVLFLTEDPDDAGYYMLVRAASRNPLVTTEQPGTQRVLARRIVSMDLRYYDGSSWFDAWDSAQREDELPLAVELVLVVQPPRRNPDNASNDDELEDDRQTVAVLIPMPASQLVPTGTAGTFDLF